jgi:hypothetical protein
MAALLLVRVNFAIGYASQNSPDKCGKCATKIKAGTGERRSLRSAELGAIGYLNIHGRPFAAESIKAMIRQR